MYVKIMICNFITEPNRRWTSVTSPIHIQPFASHAGPNVPIPTTPGRLFALFFTTQIVDIIVTETNRYAEQVMGCNTFAISSEEVRAYIGFCILMSIVRLPALRDYWRPNKYLNYAPISSKISRNHFMQIAR